MPFNYNYCPTKAITNYPVYVLDTACTMWPTSDDIVLKELVEIMSQQYCS